MVTVHETVPQEPPGEVRMWENAKRMRTWGSMEESDWLMERPVQVLRWLALGSRRRFAGSRVKLEYALDIPTCQQMA